MTKDSVAYGADLDARILRKEALAELVHPQPCPPVPADVSIGALQGRLAETGSLLRELMSDLASFRAQATRLGPEGISGIDSAIEALQGAQDQAEALLGRLQDSRATAARGRNRAKHPSRAKVGA